MTPHADWAEIDRLFNEAVDLPLHRRRAVLASASDDVREEVESLLNIDSGQFPSAPPVHLAAELLEREPSALRCGQRIGSYEVESLITVGGMGEVYRAHDASGEPAALKILRRHLIGSPHAAERFQLEARAASALHHPNIVTVRDSGESGAGLYLAMEWLDGQTLRTVIDSGPVDLALAADLSAQAARALAAAHAAGILHRDIKPDNIMLRSDGVLKILDFGLARLAGTVRLEAETMGSSGTISGTLSGTLLYMSPEILRGETAATGSDVFSLGALLYELWTGHHPFAGETPLDVFEAIECRDVPPPSTLRPGVPAQIDTLILRMIDRDPAHRPSAAEALDVFNRQSSLV